MAGRIRLILGMVRKLPVSVLVSRGLKRFGLSPFWLERLDFLKSSDTLRPDKALTILSSSMAEAGIAPSMVLDAVPGGVLLEVGCGRHAGLAPLAAVLGAKRYIGADPTLNPRLLRDPAVRKAYLAPALESAAEFAGAAGAGVDTDTLLNTARFEPSDVAAALKPDDRVDVCVSISCLEHIRDFDRAARAIAAASSPKTVHVHLVNFSNHLSKQRPFEQLYEMPNAAFGEKWRHTINGLRLPDMMRSFEAVGLPLAAIPQDVVPEALPARIDASWTDTYDRETLAIRTALLISPSLVGDNTIDSGPGKT